MKQKNAEIVAAPILTRTCVQLEIRSVPPVASLIILHFVCRTVAPNSVKSMTEEEGTDDDDYVYAIGEKKQPMCQGSTLTLTRFPLESKFTSWKVKKRK